MSRRIDIASPQSKADGLGLRAAELAMSGYDVETERASVHAASRRAGINNLD